jgi:hypothetical protein
MTDIIWTIIVIWLFFRLFQFIRIPASAPRRQNIIPRNEDRNRSENDLKKALKKRLNHEGDYIDFEELK